MNLLLAHYERQIETSSRCSISAASFICADHMQERERLLAEIRNICDEKADPDLGAAFKQP
jgi:hypothetical protein